MYGGDKKFLKNTDTQQLHFTSRNLHILTETGADMTRVRDDLEVEIPGAEVTTADIIRADMIWGRLTVVDVVRRRSFCKSVKC